MHKYQPRVHIIKKPDEPNKMHALNALLFSSNHGQYTKLHVSGDLEGLEYKTFVFPETSFIAVTAYQNQLVSRRNKQHREF